MNTLAVVLERPESLALRRLALTPPSDADIVVDVEWSGISTGTEKLLWTGRMPSFPGHGLSARAGLRVGRASHRGGPGVGPASRRARLRPRCARCFGEVRGLFGGAASRLVVDASRVVPVDAKLGEQGALLALGRHGVPRRCR